MRKTLWSRLKPEFRKGLESNKDKWSICVDSIEIELKSELFYSDLSVNSISRVWLFSDVHGGYSRSGESWKLGDDMFREEDGCT